MRPSRCCTRESAFPPADQSGKLCQVGSRHIENARKVCCAFKIKAKTLPYIGRLWTCGSLSLYTVKNKGWLERHLIDK